MTIRKMLVLLAGVLVVICLYLPAHAESEVRNKVNRREGIMIEESSFVHKNTDGSYSAYIGLDYDELIITGTYDGNGRLMVILNSVGGDMFGCNIETSNEGIWKCTIPTDALYKDVANKFVIVYYDDFENEAVCYISIDSMCELEIDAVYEDSGVISGSTEPGSEVILNNNNNRESVVADENGRFSFFVEYMESENLYIEVTDVFGNTAIQEIVVIDIDIKIFINSITNSDTCHVVVNAIPDSYIQLQLNGVDWGAPVKIDDAGKGSADIYGLEHGYSYSVAAVYAGEYEYIDVVSETVWVTVDMVGPKITADGIIIDEKTTEINVHVDEECTLMFVEETTGYYETLFAVPGKNKISLEGLSEEHEIVAGMKIVFTAFDNYGNESTESVVYDVQLPVSDMLFIAGMSPVGNKVNAMEEAKAVGQVYVQDKDYTLEVYVYGYESNMAQIMETPSYILRLNETPLKAYKADKGGKLPAFVPINLTFDAELLPMEYSYELVFHVNNEKGERLYSYNRLSLEFLLVKDTEWLIHRLILMTLLAICFMIVLYLYIVINRRHRALKRNNGTVRRGRNAGKRGGIWA